MQVSDGLGKGVAVSVDVIGGGPRCVDEGGRQVRQFGEITADVAAVRVDLMRTVGIADGSRVLCGEVPVGLVECGVGASLDGGCPRDALVGVEVEGMAEIVGTQLLENGV